VEGEFALVFLSQAASFNNFFESMKKFLILISSILSLTASMALAKTEGSSVGVAFLKSQVTHQNSWAPSTNYRDDSFGGVSLNYKHAVQVANGFYLAPGVSYDRIGTKTDTTSSLASDKVELNNRFSARADIGYDVNDTLAVYGVVGYSALGYETYNHSGDYSQKKNTYNYTPLLGAGFKTAICKHLDLTLEYTRQHANLNTSDPYQKVKTQLQTYALGLAYNF
jgi:opacity protein-like surface antigen